MQKNIKIILIISLSVAFIGIAGVFVWFFVLPKTNLLPTEEQKPGQITPTEKKPITVEMIQQNKDFTKTIFEANVNNDVALCDNISTEPEKKSCQDNFYFNQARKEGDASFCGSVQSLSLKNDCYYNTATQINDIKVCDSITLDISKQECKSKVSGNLALDKMDVSLCPTNNQLSAASCISQIMLKTRDKNSCNNIPNEGLCLASYYQIEAQSTNNIELCNQIPEPKDANNCITEFSAAGDTDNDGLNDLDEIYYGTDPNNPDTDHDGFKDGDEVKNGYNPLGAGKLVK